MVIKKKQMNKFENYFAKSKYVEDYLKPIKSKIKILESDYKALKSEYANLMAKHNEMIEINKNLTKKIEELEVEKNNLLAKQSKDLVEIYQEWLR